MRKIYNSFITKSEADILLNLSNKKLLDSNNKIINKIIKQLKKDFDFNIKKESNYQTEHYPHGHTWHIDTGINNHMPWCQIGVSILIKKPTLNGDTYYADDGKETNKVKVERSLYDLIAHTSDEWHMVEPHKGERKVFLMFI